MNRQTDIDVIINGKQYTVSGYESEEYMQRVASYINNKNAEFKKLDAFKYMDNDRKNVLMQLNIADDYFKLKQQMKERDTDNDAKNEEIYDLKHEIISLQTKLEELEKKLEQAKTDHFEEEKKVIRLETELEEVRKNLKKESDSRN